MVNYIDFNYYFKTYKGNMSLEYFNKLITKASAEVRKSIFNRDITGYEEEIKTATCAVIDVLYEIEQIKESASHEIKSESIGDYSKTYITDSDVQVKISNIEKQIKEEIRRYLIGTGLLYRGV